MGSFIFVLALFMILASLNGDKESRQETTSGKLLGGMILALILGIVYAGVVFAGLESLEGMLKIYMYFLAVGGLFAALVYFIFFYQKEDNSQFHRYRVAGIYIGGSCALMVMMGGFIGAYEKILGAQVFGSSFNEMAYIFYYTLVPIITFGDAPWLFSLNEPAQIEDDFFNIFIDVYVIAIYFLAVAVLVRLLKHR